MENNKKLLGVLGGLGPMATAYFMELVISMTKADCDQNHIPMLVYNAPFIPDRTAYILKKIPTDPAPVMSQVAKSLVREGVACIAIPCVTAHYFWQQVQNAVETPVLNVVTGTAQYLHNQGVQRAGIMATDGTISTGLLQKALEDSGITAILPDQRGQRGIMDIIYRDIKAGKKPDMEQFREVAQQLKKDGAETIILACTELSLIKRDYHIGPGFIDVMDVLAQMSVEFCGGEVKEEYRCLITG